MVGDLPNDFLSLDPQSGQGQGSGQGEGQGQAQRPANSFYPPADGSSSPPAAGSAPAGAPRTAPVRFFTSKAPFSIKPEEHDHLRNPVHLTDVWRRVCAASARGGEPRRCRAAYAANVRSVPDYNGEQATHNNPPGMFALQDFASEFVLVVFSQWREIEALVVLQCSE